MIRSALVLLVVAGLALGACTTSPHKGKAAAATPGASQPDGNGQPLSEADACKQITEALLAQSGALHCGAASYSCPDFIRPAGGEACLQYDQGSVAGCVAFIQAYTSCDDFANRPCIVTALSGTAPQGCPGGGGTGGTGGAAGAAGTGGSAGTSDAGPG